MSRWVVVGLMLGVNCIMPALAEQQVSGAAPGAADLKSRLEIAHAQHEIILLYIKTDQIDKVWPEAQALLALQFPREQELATVKSLSIITEKLRKKGRSDLAHQILAAASRTMVDRANKSKTFLIQARIYRLDGQDEKAIESYRKFQELSRPLPE